MNRGKYIVIEGPQGVGKSTQIMELTRRLQIAGLPVRTLREPDSQSDLTARAIRQLTQDPRYPMNTTTEVLLYNAARSQSLQVIERSVEQGIICVVDRNYLTTLAIQYYGRGDVPDYETINQIINFAVHGVEPDLCIVLDAPVNVLLERMAGRGAGERFDNLEASFLERVRAGYLWEAEQRKLPVVFATEDTESIANEIWKHVADTLAIRETSAASAVTPPASIKQIIENKRSTVEPAQSSSEQTDEGALLTKNKLGNFIVTPAGTEYLRDVVTSPDQDIYAFTDKLSPITIAAAMARLSRRGDDMRVTILDEFATQLGKDEKLLQRIITAYGDDSVQQLAGQHLVVENASNLLTKKLEWGRLAAYLEQSTRYIYFDKKDANGRYRYYVPPYLSNKLKKRYEADMDKLFDIYSELVHKLTTYIQQGSTVPEAERDGAWRAATRAQACDAARPLLPVATTSTVGIFASGQALESLIMHLLGDSLPEARETGKHMLAESRKVMQTFLERADKPDRGGAMIAYQATTRQKVSELAKKHLSTNYAVEQQAVTLVDYSPRNELDLVADMLYEHSDLPLDELQKQVKTWPYERKVEVFQGYMGERLNRRHRPGRALEKAHYSWDLVCDYGIFRDLQRHRMVDDMEWQLLTPRYGYDIPEIVDEAGLTDLFDQCFDISLALYSELQKAHLPLEAQYATLLGHKMRWKVTYNAREAFHFHELRTSPQGHPGYRKLVLEMHEKLAEVHPLMAEAMKFINQDENPELTRLAAERYTQFKLKKLSN
ncbi:MAG TPA: dTMP kinase [Candidatus Saccharimonadales bacterium]|nr:dTMP kinase [Candidatus Saccharimonadales bacterium]